MFWLSSFGMINGGLGWKERMRDDKERGRKCRERKRKKGEKKKKQNTSAYLALEHTHFCAVQNLNSPVSGPYI